MRRARVAPLLLAPLLLAAAAAARDVPAPRYPLRDDVGLLDGPTTDAVRRECIQLEQETTAELGVLIIDTTAGEDSRGFALRVFNSWRIGKAGRDNGVLLVFAMRDRRVELMAGVGLEDLFTRSVAERLLTGVVVPRLRSGQPREAVLEGARAVAEMVRAHEHEAHRLSHEELVALRRSVEVDTFGGGRPVGSAPSAPTRRTTAPTAEPPPLAVSTTPTPSPGPTRSAGLGLSPGTRARLGRDLARAVVFLGLLVWAGFLYYVLSRSFSTGELVMSKGGIIALALLVPVGAVALLLLTAPRIDHPEPVDLGLGGGGLLGAIIACSVTSHICPRCRKWMSINSRTLVWPTYHSSGTGERTYHCSSCRYHKVETYHISRKTRSSSRSSSSSSYRSSSGGGGGGGSSFGGGSSRGGGGGASW